MASFPTRSIQEQQENVWSSRNDEMMKCETQEKIERFQIWKCIGFSLV